MVFTYSVCIAYSVLGVMVDEDKTRSAIGKLSRHEMPISTKYPILSRNLGVPGC